jgi:hypothetical protein
MGKPDHIAPGDFIVGSNTLRNTAGKPIGVAYSQPTFLTPSVGFKSVDLVHTVYVFGDGEIVTTAVHGPHVYSDADAATGGSGAYACARHSRGDLSRQREGDEARDPTSPVVEHVRGNLTSRFAHTGGELPSS